jgi:hypothetical protein
VYASLSAAVVFFLLESGTVAAADSLAGFFLLVVAAGRKRRQTTIIQRGGGTREIRWADSTPESPPSRPQSVGEGSVCCLGQPWTNLFLL